MRTLLSILLVGVLFFSCNDDESERLAFENGKNTENNEEATKDTDYHAKEFLQDAKNSLKQEVILNTSQLPYVLTLKEGTEITIPAGAFTKDGVLISGEFTVVVYEMLKPSSMILSGTNTNYNNGAIFESDGFIFIDVKQNGVSVDQNLSSPVTVSIPTDKPDGTFTNLWIGNEEAGENGDQFAWDDLDKENNNGIINEENGAFARNGSFQFLIGKLGWINCDVFWNSINGMTTVTVKIYGDFSELASYLGYQGDTFVFFRAKGILVLAQLYTIVDGNTVKSYDNSVPIGSEGMMIAYSVKEGTYTYAEKEVTITSDISIDLNLKEITKEELEGKIKALDTYK
ncbi:MAG: hypothetical protein LBV43_04810 [Prevotella sp.]|jgi:hypothetical protein|nr:hypothetical protein [Prevotella sp.]